MDNIEIASPVVIPAELSAVPLRIGLTVSFNDPWLGDEGSRMVASYIPGGISESGELQDLAWSDCYGGHFTFEDILAGAPTILN